MATQVNFLGAMHCRGTGKNGPYDFCQVKYIQQLQPVQKENRTVIAYGGEEATVDLAPDAIHQFEGIKPGALVNLEIGPNPRNIQRNICTGVSKAS